MIRLIARKEKERGRRLSAGAASLAAVTLLGGGVAAVIWSQVKRVEQIKGILVAQSQIILETTYHNPAFNTTNTSSGTWAKNLVGGRTFMSLTNDTPFEWTQVLNPSQEYDDDFIGASGWVVNPEISTADTPFNHPFDNFGNKQYDFEFVLAPDPAYASLAAPLTPSNPPNNEYLQAIAKARTMGHPVTNVLGMEIDSGLVPGTYRALQGDRSCLWGRLIVDCGHPDFHTEIHPPAFMVTARPTPGNTNDGTDSFCIGRPYLVGQTFTVDNFPLKKHLLNEYGKIGTFRSTSIEAHPNIQPKPFRGVHLMTYTVRPPTGRQSPGDKLEVSFKFTVRTGCAVQLSPNGDSLNVAIVMNDAQYKAPPPPPRHDAQISIGLLKQINSDAGDAYEAATIAAFFDPVEPFVAGYFASKGITTDHYDDPMPVTGNLTTEALSAISGNTPVLHNDVQPYPILGQIHLKWIRQVGTQVLKRA